MPAFKHDIVFPVIARLIREQAGRSNQGWVTHREIVESLLRDEDGYRLVLEALEPIEMQNFLQKASSLKRKASSMVAWFSQTITVGTALHKDEFYREKRNWRWAYKPKQI